MPNLDSENKDGLNLNASQELLMSKYNQEDDENLPQPKKCLKKTIFQIRRFIVWAKTNPQKATILLLGIIIFILFIVIIVKNVEIGGFDAKYDKLENIKNGLAKDKADLISKGNKKDADYKQLYNEALYFKGSLFN